MEIDQYVPVYNIFFTCSTTATHIDCHVIIFVIINVLFINIRLILSVDIPHFTRY